MDLPNTRITMRKLIGGLLLEMAGSVLGDEYAIVTLNSDEGAVIANAETNEVHLIVPHYEDNEPVPGVIVVLSTVSAILSSNEQWARNAALYLHGVFDHIRRGDHNV